MPLHAWMIRGRHVRRSYFELKSSEFSSKADLEALQLRRLQDLLTYSYNSCDYYRESFDNSGFNPSKFTSLDQLSMLPLLSKSEVRDNLENGLRPSVLKRNKTLRISTSGSTGEPFSIYADQRQLEVRFASTIRSMEWTGWRFGEKQARLWHQTLGMSGLQVARERFDALLLRRIFIPAFEMSQDSIGSFIRRLENFDPKLVDGYAESLNFLAMYLRNNPSTKLNPKAVVSSAQALPATTRQTIEQELNTRVFDKYGSREFSGIAYQCQFSEHHHVIDECYIVELLTNGRPSLPGEVGEVVVTDLFNRATPLIRYRIGDLATAVEQIPACKCGRSHTLIGQIEGRTQAIVHCANGRWIPGTFFSHFFKEYQNYIRFFQIFQTTKGAFALRLVKGDYFTESALLSLIEHLRRYVGNTEIQIEYVESIPLLRTGKRSPVVSTVSVDFQHLPGSFSAESGHE